MQVKLHTIDLMRQCVSWLDAYVGPEDERYLRRRLEDLVIHTPSKLRQRYGLTVCRRRHNAYSWLRFPARETHGWSGPWPIEGAMLPC